MIALYEPRASLLHRLHPLTKLTISLGLIALALGIGAPWAPLAAYILILVPLSLLGHVARPFLRISLRLVLPFVISLFIIQSLFFPEGQTILARIGPLSIKAEGVRFAFAAAARILLIIGALLLTLLTTHPGMLMLGMTQKGLPPTLAYVIVTTLQIVPLLRERAHLIMDAQRARGLETEGSILKRARAALPLTGPLVMASLIDVEERTLALEARGFGIHGPRTSLHDLRDPAPERALRWIIALVAIGLIGVRLIEALR
jgi:energy-coupling factor transport system permease protein